MNLKAAAQQLGVHYQTAYKWVRSGALTAVRVGARYEVSDAAIAQFLASRRSLLTDVEPRPTTRRATDLTQADVLDELTAMALDPVVTASSVATFAARRGAEVLGDMCLVVLMHSDGTGISYASIDHPEPDRAAFISAAASTMSMSPTVEQNAMIVPLATGTTLRIPHVAQDDLRAAIRPELRQYLPQYAFHSLLSAPIRAEGRTSGFITFARDTTSQPYTAADEEFAARIGKRVGRLVQTAHEIKLAWKLRNDLAQALCERIARSGAHPPDTAELDHLLQSPREEPDLPIAVYDPEGRFLAANEAFQKASGFTSTALIGQSFLTLTHPDDRDAERADFARLTSGEIDYLDVHARRLGADGSSTEYASHRVAVRDPGATLDYVITVARPLHVVDLSPAFAGAC